MERVVKSIMDLVCDQGISGYSLWSRLFSIKCVVKRVLAQVYGQEFVWVERVVKRVLDGVWSRGF